MLYNIYIYILLSKFDGGMDDYYLSTHSPPLEARINNFLTLI